MEHENNGCPICGSNRRRLLIRKENRVVYRCLTCDVGFLVPFPSEGEMAALYDETYFADQYDTGIDPAKPEFRKRLRLEGHRIRFFRRLKSRGAVLDIGCGNGYFLAACRERGYTVSGLDRSEWAATYVRDTLGIESRSGALEHIQLPAGVFDVITLWHVLEHMRDPKKGLQQAGGWLKPDGLLVVEVPNYRGTDARRLWGDWVGWQLPYHLYHFTPSSLKRLLRSCGFDVIKQKTYHSEVVKKNLRRYFPVRPFARLIAKWYSGTSIAIIAVRKGI